MVGENSHERTFTDHQPRRISRPTEDGKSALLVVIGGNHEMINARYSEAPKRFASGQDMSWGIPLGACIGVHRGEPGQREAAIESAYQLFEEV